MTNLRKDWFEHVSKTRRQMQRGKKETVTHRQAMQQASSTWPKVKEKLLRKRKREERKLAREST